MVKVEMSTPTVEALIELLQWADEYSKDFGDLNFVNMQGDGRTAHVSRKELRRIKDLLETFNQ